MIVAGLDDWNESTARRVDEPRLSAKLHVSFFRRPPYYRSGDGPEGGLPARLFPSFLVCPSCNRLAPNSRFEFSDDRRGPEYSCRASHRDGRNRVAVFPARFMVACAKGHLDDFPWSHYVHGDQVPCDADLELRDSGQTGSITDLWVHCPRHDVSRNLGQAMGKGARKLLPHCSGARPWLGNLGSEACTDEVRVLLRGASNAYFPVVESAISVPPWSDPIQLAIGEYIEELQKVESVDDMIGFLKFVNAPSLGEWEPDRLWDALQRRRTGVVDEEDLRGREWAAFTSGRHHIDQRSEFQIRPVSVPLEIAPFASGLTQVLRLREVRALRGFTRIDPIPDVGDLGEVEAVATGLAHISRQRKNWLPGVDLRGEGVFLQLDEAALKEWESRAAVKDLAHRYELAQASWHQERSRKVTRLRPLRYVLLHTLAHVLIRQFGLDCGYSSASLRERIYCTSGGEPMAGILIYTATPDSEGSLGGLVEMARPELFGPLVARALEDSQLCANDPLCADREANRKGTQLNGAACHACLLESETSCEAGNNYLDRAVLHGTLRGKKAAFASR